MFQTQGECWWGESHWWLISSHWHELGCTTWVIPLEVGGGEAVLMNCECMSWIFGSLQFGRTCHLDLKSYRVPWRSMVIRTCRTKTMLASRQYFAIRGHGPVLNTDRYNLTSLRVRQRVVFFFINYPATAHCTHCNCEYNKCVCPHPTGHSY